MLCSFRVVLPYILLASAMQRLRPSEESSQEHKRRRLVVFSSEDIFERQNYNMACRKVMPTQFNLLIERNPGFFDRPENERLREDCLVQAIYSSRFSIVKTILENHMSRIPWRAFHAACSRLNSNMVCFLRNISLNASKELCIKEDGMKSLILLAINSSNLDLLVQLHDVRPLQVDGEMIEGASKLRKPGILKFLLFSTPSECYNDLIHVAFQTPANNLFSGVIRFILSIASVIPEVEENSELMLIRKSLLLTYKSVIDRADFCELLSYICLLSKYKQRLFFLAVMTAVGVDNLDLAFHLLEWNCEIGNIDVNGLGSQLIDVASLTGNWDVLSDPRIQPHIIFQEEYNWHMRECRKTSDFFTFYALIFYSPKFMVQNWLSSLRQSNLELQTYNLLNAARQGEYSFILLFSTYKPYELRLIEYAWKILLNPSFESFLPFVQSSLINSETRLVSDHSDA